MKYFIVEGILKDSDKINEDIMKKHMTYTQKAMDEGMILVSGLKSDMSGGIFIIKAESVEKLESYLSKEPFKLYGIQDYKFVEFNTHYFNPSPSEWFK
ncbi:YciI family protein [Clostridium perfringens]|uniref:YciI family protein n=1 Tax=Clostridium perfringens TaxID=1502 RepID=UPI0023425C2D|nr:YciI family protein [Clostridium perfringens]MDC4250822.1 YciI family protein [Clostridium perfringens]